MFRCTALLLIFNLTFVLLKGQSTLVNSQPTAVTIYTKGAIVKRSFTASLQPGTNDIVVGGLSGSIDEQSIKITAPEGVQIRSAAYLPQGNTRSLFRFRALADSLDTLNLKYNQLKNYRTALDEEFSLLKLNRKITPSEKGVFIDDLEEAADFYRSRIPDILNRMNATDKKLAAMRRKIKSLSDYLHIYPTGEIHLLATAQETSGGEFNLMYKTTNASWTPSYELNVGQDQQASISYFASIRQRTGEDWSNTPLTLNTGMLYFSDSAFNQVWYISAIGDTVLPSPGIYTADNAGLPLPQLTSLPSDTAQHTVLISQNKVPYLVIDIIRPDIHLEALSYVQIQNWQDDHYRPGSLTVYNGNTYIGGSKLNTSLLTDTLLVNAGEDTAITVDRMKIKEDSKKQFLGSHIKQTLNYTISLQNKSSEVKTILLQVHIPVSLSKEIEVNPENISNATYDAKSGMLQWQLKLNAGQNIQIPYAYSVKYPQGISISGFE